MHEISRWNVETDRVERDCGPMTLAFGASDVARYVDCGGATDYGTPEPYARRSGLNHQLRGRMTIRIRDAGGGRPNARVWSL